jgi:hypothetical protein
LKKKVQKFVVQKYCKFEYSKQPLENKIIRLKTLQKIDMTDFKAGERKSFYNSQNGRTKNISLVCYTSKEIAMKINKKNTIINNNRIQQSKMRCFKRSKLFYNGGFKDY